MERYHSPKFMIDVGEEENDHLTFQIHGPQDSGVLFMEYLHQEFNHDTDQMESRKDTVFLYPGQVAELHAMLHMLMANWPKAAKKPRKTAKKKAKK